MKYNQSKPKTETPEKSHIEAKSPRSFNSNTPKAFRGQINPKAVRALSGEALREMKHSFYAKEELYRRIKKNRKAI